MNHSTCARSCGDGCGSSSTTIRNKEQQHLSVHSFEELESDKQPSHAPCTEAHGSCCAAASTSRILLSCDRRAAKLVGRCHSNREKWMCCDGTQFLAVLLLLLASILSCALDMAAAAPPAASELPLLETLRVSLDPAGSILQSWTNVTSDCSDWLGLTCNDATGAVVQISLGNSNLVGNLSTALGELSSLTSLDLSNNALKGEIPPLDKLTDLQVLELGQNQLTGEIPTGIGSLRALNLVNLRTNKLSGGIPESFGNLDALSYLDMSANELSGPLPSTLGNLKNLQTLTLGFNKLSGPIPSTFTSLTALTIFHVLSNALTGTLPAGIGNLKQLSYFVAGSNSLEGSIPDEISNWVLLKSFDMSLNVLNGSMPSAIGSLTNLDTLLLSFNSMTGSIPAALGLCTSLVNLRLGFNKFNGSFPVELFGLTMLKYLELSNNVFSGPLPEDLSGLSGITYIGMDDNVVGGPIPASLGALTDLEHLDLRRNRISGNLPLNELSGLVSLTLLDISYNQITGNLPESLGKLTSLSYIDLSVNNFTGPLPAQIPALPKLQTLNMGRNSLSGRLPVKLSDSLKTVSLGYNMWKSSLPPSFAALTGLSFLSIVHSEVTGSIPPLGGMTSLLNIIIADNKLTGTMPATFPPNLVAINFHHNDLTGPLPSRLLALPDLQSVVLQYNELSGDVPNFPNATGLIYLSLFDNRFAGDVSEELQNRGNLEFLMAGNPWCRDPERQTLSLCSSDVNGNGNQTWTPPVFCPALSSCPLGTSPNSALYTALGNCTCTQYLRVDLLFPAPAFGIFSGAIALLLREALVELIHSSLSGRRYLSVPQIWVQQGTSIIMGEQLVVLHFFTEDGQPWSRQQKGEIVSIMIDGKYQELSAKGTSFGRFYVLGDPSAIINQDLTIAPPVLAPPPPPSVDVTTSSTSSGGGSTSTGLIVGIVVAVVLLLLLVVGVAFWFFLRQRRLQKELKEASEVVAAAKAAGITTASNSCVSGSQGGSSVGGGAAGMSTGLSDLTIRVQDHFVKAIPISVILEATNSFSQACLLGEGGHGSVYKAKAPSGQVWAVKRSKIVSLRGLQLFQNEVDNLSKVSHRNLVKLLGYCDQSNEQILIYEFISNGSLMDHIRPKDGVTKYPPLTFEQRLEIAIGSAEGLHYLHSFANPGIIHRDVKSENILLTANLQPKLADFGLLKSFNDEDSFGGGRHAAVSTRVAGTPGYMDPEYYKTFKVTTKSDVYSFGVVLLELISGKPPAMDQSELRGSSIGNGGRPAAPAHHLITIAEWAFPLIASGDIDSLADPHMPFAGSTAANGGGDQEDPVVPIDPEAQREALRMMATVAFHCIQRDSVDRPDMGDVVRLLSEIRYELKGKRPTAAFTVAREGGAEDYAGAPLMGDGGGLTNISESMDMGAPASIILGGR